MFLLFSSCIAEIDPKIWQTKLTSESSIKIIWIKIIWPNYHLHRWTNVAVEVFCKHGSASNKYPLSTFGNSETPLLPKILSLIETYCSSSLILSHRHSGTFTDMQLASAPKCLKRPNTALWFVKKKKLALPLWKTFLWRARKTAFQATNCTALANRSRPEKNIPNFSILTTGWLWWSNTLVGLT